MTTETTDERSPARWGWNAAIKSLTRGLNPEYCSDDDDNDDDYHSLDDDILKLCRTNYYHKSLSLSSSTSLDDDDDDSSFLQDGSPWENVDDDDDSQEDDSVYWGVAQDKETTTRTTAVNDESIYSQPAGISYNDWAATGYASMEMVQAAREKKVALDMLSTCSLPCTFG